MYLVKYFTNSEAARTRFASYKCGLCGHDDNFRAEGDNWNEEEKKCPKCGCINPEDKQLQLKVKREGLLNLMDNTKKELDSVEADIEIIESQYKAKSA